MPEQLEISVLSEQEFSGVFGPQRLVVSRDACNLSRLTSRGGLPFLADHDSSRPLGAFQSARIDESTGFLYASVDLIESARNVDYLDEIRSGLRRGVSGGLLLHAVELEKNANDEIVTVITGYSLYEGSSVSTPKLETVGVLGISGSQDRKASRTTRKASQSVPAPAPKSAPKSPVTQRASLIESQNPAAPKAAPRRRSQMTTNPAATPPIQQQKPAPAVDARLSLAAGVKAVLDVATSPSQAHSPDGLELLTAFEGHASGDVLLEKFALTTLQHRTLTSRRAATYSFRR